MRSRSAVDQTEPIVMALSQVNPVSPEETVVLAESHLPKVRATLLEEHVWVDNRSAEPTRRPRRPLWGGATRTGWTMRAAALVMAVALVAIGVNVFRPSGASAEPAHAIPLAFAHGTHANAVRVLRHAASTVAASSRPGSGPVRYTEVQQYAPQTVVAHHQSTTTVGTTILKIWYAADGSTMVREFNQAQAQIGGDIGGPKPLPNIDHTNWSRWPDPNRDFPSKPAPVRLRLAHVTSSTRHFDADTLSGLKQEAAAHLQTGTATSGQAAAIYQVLASTSDVFDAGTVTDRIGRKGHAIGLPLPNQEPGNSADLYIILDPVTGTVLQTETTMARPPSSLHVPDQPWVDEYNLVRHSRFVAQPGQE